MAIRKKFHVQDPKALREEFYRNYPEGYWLYRISLLKNAHDSFDAIKDSLTRDLEDAVAEDYKRMMRAEMHFLYFQMVEALFEIVFALCDHDNRDLWVALTFGEWGQTYRRVKQLAEGKLLEPNLQGMVRAKFGGEEVEMSRLRWLFYFGFPLSLTPEEWEKTIRTIRSLLTMFARDFSDRDDYNAYKHSLRFYSSSYSFGLGKPGEAPRLLGKGNDAINFLEEEVVPVAGGEPEHRIRTTMKSFDFERDYRCAITVESLIGNLIKSRKYSMFSDLVDEKFNLHRFDGLDLAALQPHLGVARWSVQN